jgi:hypothetical protein
MDFYSSFYRISQANISLVFVLSGFLSLVFLCTSVAYRFYSGFIQVTAWLVQAVRSLSISPRVVGLHTLLGVASLATKLTLTSGSARASRCTTRFCWATVAAFITRGINTHPVGAGRSKLRRCAQRYVYAQI